MTQAHAEVTWIERLMVQLDKDQPRWATEWAQEQELRDFAEAGQHNDNYQRAKAKLRSAIARRLFHRILNAALGAGIVKDTETTRHHNT